MFPEAPKLPQDKLQRIAREFDVSETTFVYPPDDPAHTASVRIFTPTMEVPFAGASDDWRGGGPARAWQAGGDGA